MKDGALIKQKLKTIISRPGGTYGKRAINVVVMREALDRIEMLERRLERAE